ncbi:MAG: hypothetical protein M1834_006982 [Cirrosporium novae-zelandiae]|nr:MAG: hypothetical protein M1834_006982 [Cirrosporium novae-zelandiae]
MIALTGHSRLRGKWLQGVMSGIIGANNQFGVDFNHPDDKLQGLIVSIYDIGCAVGSLGSFAIGDRVGRKAMILTGGSTMIVGTAILASSTTLAQLLIGRIVTGIGNGFNSSNIPAYQAELCDASKRGMLLSAQGTVTILGLCIAYWLDFAFSYIGGPIQWRFPIAFQAFFAICLVLQTLSLPETPRYLILKGQPAKASQVLSQLNDVDLGHHKVLHLRAQIETAVEAESAGGPFRYSELFEGGKLQNFRRICIACMVNVMQQFTGANMINYYAPTVYEKTMGLSRTMSLILGGCTSLTYLVGSIIPLWAMDRFGRRTLMMASASGLCLCFSLVAILLSLDTRPTAYAATGFIFLFFIFFGFGWLPIPWFYPSEITTTRIRSKGQAIASFINWMCVFTVVQITPIAISNINWRVFIIWAVLCFFWVIITYIFFPETTGLELEDIDHLFEKGGITGGVLTSKGGRTVRSHQHEMNVGLDDDKELGKGQNKEEEVEEGTVEKIEFTG